MKRVPKPVWAGAALAVFALGIWLGDVPNRYRASRCHLDGQAAELAGAWTRSLADFRQAQSFRPSDIGYAVDYDNAQAKWLETVRSGIDGFEPEQAYAYLLGEPAHVSMLLVDPNSADFERLVGTVTKGVKGNAVRRLGRAVSLADNAEFVEAYREVDLARPYAGLVPNFQTVVNRVQVSEVDHAIRVAAGLARKGDFKDAYLVLEAVREHSNLEPGYDGAVLAVRKGEVRWNIAAALVLSRNGDYEGAETQLSALDSKRLLAPEVAAAKSRVRADAQFWSIQRLGEAVLKGDVGETRKVMDRYGRLTGYRFACQPETLIEERDLGRFLAALEDLHIRPKGNESRTGWLDLHLVESLRNRFTDQAKVSSFLGEGYKSYSRQLADNSRPGSALYLMECAKREGVEPDPAVPRRLLAALADAFGFTIFLPPTRTTASHPGPLVTAPRAAAGALLRKTVGSWIRLSDVPLPRSPSGLVLSTSLANIKVADNPQSETRTVRYQSGWDQVPNPEYANIAEQLRQAQQNEQQVAAQDAANQRLAQSAVNSGSMNMWGAALTGAAAGVSKAALQTAQENVNAWSVKLQATPSTLQNAVFADEPYEATTHSISYDASFSANLEVGGSPSSDPLTWASNYSYNTVEIVGNVAHNVPVQAATYVSMDNVVQTLADSISRKLTDQSGLILSRLMAATQAVLDHELQMGRVSEEVSADARWGLLALWKTSNVPIDQNRARTVEVTIRRELGLDSNPATPSPNSRVTGSAGVDRNRGQAPAPVATPVSLARSPAQPPAAAPPVPPGPVPATVQRGFLGLRLEALTPERAAQSGLNSGALVTNVESDGPAKKAGLMSGDIITKFNGEAVTDGKRFVAAVPRLPPGTSVTIEYVRNGQPATATAELGVRPPPPGFFGVRLEELTPELAAQYGAASGALVAGTTSGGPADKAGLASGDIITKLDGAAMADLSQVVLAVKRVPPGRMLTVEYVRNRQTATTTVELGAGSSP